jgi:hypothetical protein
VVADIRVRRRHSHCNHHGSPGRGDRIARPRSGNHVLPQQAVRPGRPARVRARSARQAPRSYT